MKKPENQAINGHLVFFEQVMVGKTGRTVTVNEAEIQYVNIIGFVQLTYQLTGTDRLERTFEKEMNQV